MPAGIQSHVARVRANTRHHGPDDPRTLDARRALEEARFEASVERDLAELSHPLSDQTRLRLIGRLVPITADGVA